MIIALVIILFWEIFGGIPEIFEFISLSTFKSCLIGWLILSFIAFCVVELKYLLIRILSSLLNVDKIAQIHFFDFCQNRFDLHQYHLDDSLHNCTLAE